MKELIRKIARAAGYEIHRRTPADDPLPIEKSIIRRLGLENAAILDVGAHHGLTALQYAHAFPQATIYSFEPFPESMAILHRNVAGHSRIVPVPSAVSEKSGETKFFLNQFSATHSLLPRPSGGHRYYASTAGPAGEVTVPVTTLDEFTASRSIERVAILKLDIQGGELMALRGASRLLSEHPPALIFTEIQFVPHYEGAPLALEVLQMLRGAGYALVNFFGTVTAANGQLRYSDALLIHDSVRAVGLESGHDEP
ncbi:MAG: FkbM family methyltransferase [Thermoanaerobaculia bacterium]